MCRLALFFEGGISYEYLRGAPLDEVMTIYEEAKAVNKEREAEAKKMRRRNG